MGKLRWDRVGVKNMDSSSGWARTKITCVMLLMGSARGAELYWIKTLSMYS